MRKPKMIIFDAGRTLIDYVAINTLNGVRAIMPYITSNPRNLTAEEIDAYTNHVFSLFDASRKQLFEVHEQNILKMVYDLLGITFSIGIAEIERIIWTEDAQKVPSAHAGELLEQLHLLGIQTAVISNLDFSGYLLQEKLDELYPNNHFQFVIASSDYGVRKPNSYIFEAGISKSGFDSGDIWYVGDKLAVDISGSSAVGMVPILYKCPRNYYPDLPDDLVAIDDFMEIMKLIDHE